MGEHTELNDVAVDIVGIKKDVRALEKRMDNQDDFNGKMQDLVTSVKLLAENMKNMLDEQKAQKEQLEKQGAKIQEIMMKPARSWNTMQRTIFVALTSAFITAFVTLLVQHLF
jgi:aconitase A